MKRLLVLAAFVSLIMPSMAEAKRIGLSMDFGQDVLLASNGPVTVRARCVENDGGLDKLMVYATTESNAVLRGFNVYPGNGSYLTAVTPPEMSVLGQNASITGIENVSNTIDGSHVMHVETLRGFVVQVESSVLGLNTGPDDCLLSLELVAIKKFKVLD